MQIVLNASILWNVTVTGENRLPDTVAVTWKGMDDDSVKHLKVQQTCPGCVKTKAHQCILHWESQWWISFRTSQFAVTGSFHI